MSDPADEGMSTAKKVAAGAAVGVAIPAAVGVAKKLLGDDGDAGQDASNERNRTARSAGSSKTTGKKRSANSGSGRTKEQLYATAKRLKIDGRSKMSKAQLERAVERAKR